MELAKPSPNRDPGLRLPPHTRVLACKVFAPEIRYLGVPEDRVTFLDQGLHITPKRLRRELAAGLADLEQDRDTQRVVVLYGYCGGGLEGLTSRRVELAVPLAHDCIPLILGGNNHLLGQPGVFYLSPGWIDYGRTPLTEYQEIARRWGEEDALWVSRRIMKGYHRAALITNPGARKERYLEYTREMARIYDMSLLEVPGDPGWLKRLLKCKAGPGVLILPPGRAIELEFFLGAPGAAAMAGDTPPA